MFVTRVFLIGLQLQTRRHIQDRSGEPLIYTHTYENTHTVYCRRYLQNIQRLNVLFLKNVFNEQSQETNTWSA